MDNALNCDSYIIVHSLQTYGSYLNVWLSSGRPLLTFALRVILEM
jgi:hypothetical protein